MNGVFVRKPNLSNIREKKGCILGVQMESNNLFVVMPLYQTFFLFLILKWPYFVNFDFIGPIAFGLILMRTLKL